MYYKKLTKHWGILPLKQNIKLSKEHPLIMPINKNYVILAYSINHPYSASISIPPHSFELVYFIQIGANHCFFSCNFNMNTLRIAFRGKFLLCNNYFNCNRSKLAKCQKSDILQSTRATYFQISLNIQLIVDLKVLFSVFSIHIQYILLLSL